MGLRGGGAANLNQPTTVADNLLNYILNGKALTDADRATIDQSLAGDNSADAGVFRQFLDFFDEQQRQGYAPPITSQERMQGNPAFAQQLTAPTTAPATTTP